MRTVYINFAVRKNPWSNSLGGANRFFSLTFFTDPERYYIELSIKVLSMNLAEGFKGIFGCQKRSFPRRRRHKFFVQCR